MNGPSVVREHTWKSADFPLCQVAFSAAELASRLGLPLLHWEEDGLGPSTGFLCQLPTGLVVLVQDFTLKPGLGASLHIDASELTKRGIQSPLQEVLSGFKLTRDALTWEQTEDGLQGARLVVEHCQKFRGSNAV